MSKYYLVAYVVNFYSRHLRILRPVFGEDFKGSVLPVASSSFASIEEATERLADLLRAGIPDGFILIQPEPEQIPRMEQDRALALVKKDPEWAALLERFEIDDDQVDIHAKEHARCWAIVAKGAKYGIPPGVGFVVDKNSGQVFSQYFIDMFAPDGNPL